MISEEDISDITESQDADQDNQNAISESGHFNLKDKNKSAQPKPAHRNKYLNTSTVFKLKEDILDYF
jgi:hypothetical protein